ncbi:hypothetical protein V5S82_10630 [Corynebacterium marquesiae]
MTEVRSNNSTERLNREIRRRIDVVGPSLTAGLRFAWSALY